MAMKTSKRVSKILARRRKEAMLSANDTELANIEMDRYFQDDRNRDRFSRLTIEPDVGDPRFDEYQADGKSKRSLLRRRQRPA